MQRTASLLLFLSAVAALSVATYFAIRVDWSAARPTSIAFLFVVPMLSGLGLLAAARFGGRARVAIATNLLAVCLAVYGAELYIQATPAKRISVEEYAAQLCGAFDPSTSRVVAADLKREFGAADDVGHAARVRTGRQAAQSAVILL